MSYGIEIYDKDGYKILDNERLLHRFWDSVTLDSVTKYYYDEKLDHEPTVVSVCLAPHVLAWNHITDNGDYLGIETYDPNPEYYDVDSHNYTTKFIVFARR